jgi:uncharacterized membrane protein
MPNHRRHLQRYEYLSRPFGHDRFGIMVEKSVRSVGTAKFILWQTVVVLIWVALNSNIFHLGVIWDIYPFILLNLMFSTQAAYATPFIMLAQTRQADRDKAHADAITRHNQEESDLLKQLINENTNLTLQIKRLVEELNVNTGPNTKPPA